MISGPNSTFTPRTTSLSTIKVKKNMCTMSVVIVTLGLSDRLQCCADTGFFIRGLWWACVIARPLNEGMEISFAMPRGPDVSDVEGDDYSRRVQSTLRHSEHRADWTSLASDC